MIWLCHHLTIFVFSCFIVHVHSMTTATHPCLPIISHVSNVLSINATCLPCPFHQSCMFPMSIQSISHVSSCSPITENFIFVSVPLFPPKTPPKSTLVATHPCPVPYSPIIGLWSGFWQQQGGGFNCFSLEEVFGFPFGHVIC